MNVSFGGTYFFKTSNNDNAKKLASVIRTIDSENNEPSLVAACKNGYNADGVLVINNAGNKDYSEYKYAKRTLEHFSGIKDVAMDIVNENLLADYADKARQIDMVNVSLRNLGARNIYKV